MSLAICFIFDIWSFISCISYVPRARVDKRKARKKINRDRHVKQSRVLTLLTSNIHYVASFYYFPLKSIHVNIPHKQTGNPILCRIYTVLH